ncbi:unnamed protein product [Paramecium primaurelia]|uniref:Uncharacterized protein n=1 Tax=Paramecium primaurelia TaxID=5886 RepID=A0A8S1PSW7_PARPR|nr:unnamed protein product [Paramecium primaurelia]
MTVVNNFIQIQSYKCMKVVINYYTNIQKTFTTIRMTFSMENGRLWEQVRIFRLNSYKIRLIKDLTNCAQNQQTEHNIEDENPKIMYSISKTPKLKRKC